MKRCNLCAKLLFFDLAVRFACAHFLCRGCAKTSGLAENDCCLCQTRQTQMMAKASDLVNTIVAFKEPGESELATFARMIINFKKNFVFVEEKQILHKQTCICEECVDYSKYQSRLDSFTKNGVWPQKGRPSPATLARIGAYFAPTFLGDDRTICYACHLSTFDWEEDHWRFSPMEIQHRVTSYVKGRQTTDKCRLFYLFTTTNYLAKDLYSVDKEYDE